MGVFKSFGVIEPQQVRWKRQVLEATSTKISESPKNKTILMLKNFTRTKSLLLFFYSLITLC